MFIGAAGTQPARRCVCVCVRVCVYVCVCASVCVTPPARRNEVRATKYMQICGYTHARRHVVCVGAADKLLAQKD